MTIYQVPVGSYLSETIDLGIKVRSSSPSKTIPFEGFLEKLNEFQKLTIQVIDSDAGTILVTSDTLKEVGLYILSIYDNETGVEYHSAVVNVEAGEYIPTGIQGIKGDRGIQGFTGIQGIPGSGSQGIQGITGSQGIGGIVGSQGLQGGQGFQGIQGLQGIQGIIGIQGYTGSQGIQGGQGLQGNKGAIGNTGMPGIQGIQGSQGIQGLQGVQGIQGIQGVQSVQGIQGIQGTQGTQGLQGIQGIQSIQGLQGIQGDFGIQGTQGIQSLQGIQGWRGMQGIQGLQCPVQGVQGIQGIQSVQGVQGIQGRQGLQGLQGLQGYGGDGAPGPPGIQGVQGTAGSVQGIQGVQGLQGPSIQGVQGMSGSVQGLQGLQGWIGVTGDPATVMVDDITIGINGISELFVRNGGISDLQINTGIDSSKIADGSVSNTEFQYISSVTSNVQDQLNVKAPINNPTFTGEVAMTGGYYASDVTLWGYYPDPSNYGYTLTLNEDFSAKTWLVRGSTIIKGYRTGIEYCDYPSEMRLYIGSRWWDDTLNGGEGDWSDDRHFLAIKTDGIYFDDVLVGSGGGGSLDGSGTIGRIPHFNTASSIADTNIFYNTATGVIGIGVANTTTNLLRVAGAIYATSNITANSDIRTKNIIGLIPTVLPLFDKINPIEFEYKSHLNKKLFGYSAQELYAIYPQISNYNVEDDSYGIDMMGMCALNTKAIKELKEEIEKLKGYDT